ncbi:MAG: membrane protein insertase YidC [Aestuariivita sp.]|uniref:membrane protein insertase YidC n=1 Tax=Aestuariivita sp. TaxID=1872407 RepID=UPI003BB0CFB6
MDDQNKNLILATALSFIVILVWFVLFPPPEPEPRVDQTASVSSSVDENGVATVPQAAGTTIDTEAPQAETREDALAAAPRVAIDTPRLTGSVSVLGGRIDDLSLKDYRTELSPDAPIVTMLSPVDGPHAYYALYGWAAGAGLTADLVPGPNTVWTVTSGETLTPENPVTLSWNNGTGLTFTRQISVDDDYMFDITQEVQNTGGETVSLAPYGIIARHGEPEDLKNFFILHEGAVAMADGELFETDYDDFETAADHETTNVTGNGWTGFTDHYWMTTLIPQPGSPFEFSTFHDTARDIYQTTTKLQTVTLAAGETASFTTQLFAGAKEWEAVRDYQRNGIEGFIDSIDWGWFFFLTKPIFWLLHELNILIGNMGWSIIALTLIIKAVLFPLAYKSYVSMAKMKELQPQMEALKERAGDDRQKLQQGMMELYKKEKVNPAAGCLPILLQIPIFFSLYKVIFVTIELRHAPWLGPFQDLSAPDPTSILNLFGLLGNASPEPGSIMALVFIGILPLLLGISMWLQQKLNPAPTDPTQKMVFAWLPWVFMFMLGGFASGLVIYWIANNTITFIQQYSIMRSQGYKPDVFGNIRGSFNRKADAATKPKTGGKDKS